MCSANFFSLFVKIFLKIYYWLVRLVTYIIHPLLLFVFIDVTKIIFVWQNQKNRYYRFIFFITIVFIEGSKSYNICFYSVSLPELIVVYFLFEFSNFKFISLLFLALRLTVSVVTSFFVVIYRLYTIQKSEYIFFLILVSIVYHNDKCSAINELFHLRNSFIC